jgi:hypothetical protein
VALKGDSAASRLGVVMAVEETIAAIVVNLGRRRKNSAISGRFGFAAPSVDVASRLSAN